MTAELGRFLLVRLERDLHPSRVVGIGLVARSTPGVVSVTDLAAISPDTLAAIMLAPDPEVVDVPAVMQEQLFEGVA